MFSSLSRTRASHATLFCRGLSVLGLGLSLAASATAQRFQFDYGAAGPAEIGTALIPGPSSYGVLGTRNQTDLLVLGADSNGAEVLDYAVSPLTASNLTPHDALSTSSGGFIATGEVRGGSADPDQQVFLAAFDANGALVNGVQLLIYRGHATGIQKGPRVIERSGGGFAVVTNMEPGTPAARGALFGTLASLGLQWRYEYRYSNQPIELHDLCEDTNGDLIACGTIKDPQSAGRRRLFLMRTTALGIPVPGCAMSFGEAQPDFLDVEHTALTRTKDGAFAIWGHYGPLSSRPGSFLAKIGGPCFQQFLCKTEYPTVFHTRATIEEYPNGDLICNGRVVDMLGTNDGCVLRMNASCGLLSARAYGSAGTAEELYQVAPTSDGGYAAIGSSQIVSAPANAYLVKTDTSGALECHERALNLVPQPRYLTPRPHMIVHERSLGMRYIYIRQDPPWSDPSNLCSEPSCVRAPRNLSLWLPFDETSGTTAGNALAMSGAPHGAHTGSPLPTPTAGKVEGALALNGSQNFVSVPHHGAIDIGTGDFSIDAWIRLPASPSSGVQALVDKRVSTTGGIFGYSFFLYTTSSGSTQLGLQLADGTFANYLSPALAFVPNTWHFVAVTVRRSSGSSYFAFDGSYFAFTAGHPGSLVNTASLSVGRNSAGFGTSGFVGAIDELELFRRALAPIELHGLWQAGAEGKCKESCFLPSVRGICHGSSSVIVTGSVCNATKDTQSYTLWFTGSPAGSGCNVQGPTSFTSDPTFLTSVPSMSCKKFSVTIQRPAQMTQIGQLACYEMLVSSTSGTSMLCSGKIKDAWWVDCPALISGDAQILKVRQPASVGPLRIRNLGSAAATLPYRLTALDAFGAAEASVLSLNGLPPGTPASGTALFAPNGSADLDLTAEFVDWDGLRPFYVQIEADTDADGIYEILGTQTLRCHVGDTPLATYIGTAAPTTQGTPRLELDQFPTTGATMRVLGSGLVPHGISILGASFALAQPPLPLSLLNAQPAANLYLDLITMMAFTLGADASGHASLPAALPDDPFLIGASVYFQIFDIDPALPYALPIGCSSAMQVSLF
ncbi:MAG: LamG domain-containing protein [Planctomycetes bacterium]|nr:LamG domain-containing protein [Planctomycetota bacterium]